MTFGVANDNDTIDVLDKYPLINEFVETCHGAGINGDWYVEETNKNIILYNHFDVLNEVGMEDGTVSFKVIIPKDNIMDFRVQCTGDRYRWNKYLLAEYIHGRIDCVLSELMNYEDQYPHAITGYKVEKIYSLVSSTTELRSQVAKNIQEESAKLITLIPKEEKNG